MTDVETLEILLRLLKRGKRVALSTIIDKKGSGPREPGAKMIVCEDGQTFGTIGGGNLERAIINESLNALKLDKPMKVVLSLSNRDIEEGIKTGLICGGELTVFIDIFRPNPKIILIGAGHVSQAIARIAEIIGFEIIVLDDDAQLANKERFPMAKEILVGDFSEILDNLKIGPYDFVVIAHGEPGHDYLALERVLRKKPVYVGLLGSKTKALRLIERLRETGLEEKDLKPLHAPVGLDIGAQTPEEIAISILAEIILKRRKDLPHQ
ncbi:MAG: XdhC family protein [candidate division WOR-3 bacterium]